MSNFLKDPRTNWKYITIVVLLGFIVGGGILAWQYFEMQKEKIKVPEEKITEEVVKLYPRSSELFEACLKSYYPGLAEMEEAELKKLSEEELERLKIQQEIYSIISDKEVEKAVEGINSERRIPEGAEPEEIEKMIITAKDFETKLEEGYSLPEWAVFNYLCRNNLIDESLRPPEYNKVCKTDPSCCDLPEPKDIESAKKLVKKMMECQNGESFEIVEIEKLKYGYLIIGPSSEWGSGFYLTDSGCLSYCYMPFAYMEGIKGPLYQKRIAELEFERLPEEVKAKVRDFENKIESLYEKAISEKNAEICEEIKRGVEKVEAVSKEKGPGDWEFEAMRRNDLAYTWDNEYYEPCIKIIAVKLNDESLCDKMPSPKYCRKDLFLQYTDLCPEMPVDIIARAEHCKKMGWGITAEEESLCVREIENIRAKEDCIKKIALETGNIKLCKKILDKDCQNELAIKLNKPEECVWSSCYQQIAIEHNRPELCKKLSNEAFCVAKVGYKKDGLMGWKLCDKYFGLTQHYEIENCYSYFGTEAGTEGNVRICEWIPVGKGSCKLEVARRTNDVELCGTNQKCIMEIAVNTNNPKLCRKLTSFSNWQECYQKLGLEPVHGFLGVTIAPITSALQDIMELPVDYGALVQDLTYGKSPIFPDSSAEKAGIKEGDIILEVDGQKINQDNPLGEIITKYIAGDEVSLKILREGKQKEVKATLGSFPLEKYKEATAEKSVEEVLEEQKELSGWKTFQNKGYGYEIKYPASCYYEYPVAGGRYYLPYPQFKCSTDLCYSIEFKEIIFQKIKWELFPALVKEVGRFPLSISIHHGFSRIAGLENFKLKTDLESEEIKIQETGEETLPEDLKVSFYESARYPEKGDKMIIIQWTKKDDPSKLCEIEMGYKDETDKRLKIYNQMLSTFKFLE